MSLVTAENLGLAFGRKVLFSEATFAVQPGEKLGLVGPNGSGKSSLLKLISGGQEPDEGELYFAKGVRVGYLPQDILELPPGTLVESVRASVPERSRLEGGLAAVEAELSAAKDDAERIELAGRLAGLHEELAAFEERYGKHRAEELLGGLGFAASELTRDVKELSGGWKMRVALAGLLLLDPELLLLDEPTNHLDIPTLEWFDGFLRRSRKSLVLVSHDREFLNRQIGRVLSLEPEGLRSYVGTYDDYRRQRSEEETNLELRAKRQAAQRAETLAFIERFRSKATKARQVQSRIKQLEKVEKIEVRESRATVRFRFPEVPRSGKEVVRIEGIAKAYGEKVIYRDLSQTVQRGDRIAIIGVNGAGKTTLLRLLASELEADRGSVTLGHNVSLAYYAQHHTDTLDRSRTILAEIAALVPTKPQSFVRSVLGSFLFSGDDVEKPIGVLSGGERARVALARLLVLPSNLMLMDEPTNHLDLDSTERLVEALADYDGTLLFVSHNKSFINQLATRVWDVHDGQVRDWPGNLDAYLYHLAQLGESWGAAPPKAQVARSAESERERRAREATERNERNRKTRPLRQTIAELEAEIEKLEADQATIEPQLADPAIYEDFERSQPLLACFQANKALLDERLATWEAKQEELAALEKSA